MRWRFATGLVISLILLVLLFWKVPVHDVVEALRTANPWYLGATILLHLVVLTLKTVRWSVVLRAIPDSLSASSEEPPSGDPTYARRWLVFDSLFLG
ncbi:MAG: hypothetical protein CL928_13015, partial [Deltaproteobacteria bacterium]|nr:hypothetical protein [Deltaproteobacteria bacterium]